MKEDLNSDRLSKRIQALRKEVTRLTGQRKREERMGATTLIGKVHARVAT